MAKQISFFFSGAKQLNLPQLDVNESLGGYISNTPLPKNLINSLFSSLSNYDLANASTDTIAIFIKNTGTEVIEELSILSIYEQLHNEETNICKFEFAAVTPSEEGFIELIGSRKEYPLYAEFFEPQFKREEALLKILTPGAIGDPVELLGVDINLTGTSVESVVDDLVSAFKNNATYLVEKASESEVYIRRKSLELLGTEVELISPGDASSNIVNLVGFDNSYVISENLALNGILGLWIKRSVIDERVTCDLNSDTDKVEDLELVFSF